jgi:copper chaperone CopZ
MGGIAPRVYDLRKLLPAAYYCQGCAERVCAAVRALDGVVDGSCDLEEGLLSVEHDPARLPADTLDSALQRIALEQTDRVAHAVYRLTGLD